MGSCCSKEESPPLSKAAAAHIEKAPLLSNKEPARNTKKTYSDTSMLIDSLSPPKAAAPIMENSGRTSTDPRESSILLTDNKV